MSTKLIPVDLPTTTPVDTDTFKAATRISHTADDTDIARILLAATERVEDLTGRTFTAAQWRYEIDTWPFKKREIDLGCKIASVDSITYTDSSGNPQTLATGDYTVDARSPRGTVYLAEDEDDWPDGTNIKITFTLEVPKTAIQAIILLANHWYEHREDWTEAKGAPVPHGVMDLIRQISAEGVMV